MEETFHIDVRFVVFAECKRCIIADVQPVGELEIYFSTHIVTVVDVVTFLEHTILAVVFARKVIASFFGTLGNVEIDSVGRCCIFVGFVHPVCLSVVSPFVRVARVYYDCW